MTRHSANKC